MVKDLIALRTKLIDSLKCNDPKANGLINQIAEIVNMYYKRFPRLRGKMGMVEPIEKFDLDVAPPPYVAPERLHPSAEKDAPPVYTRDAGVGTFTDSKTGVETYIDDTDSVAI